MNSAPLRAVIERLPVPRGFSAEEVLSLLRRVLRKPRIKEIHLNRLELVVSRDAPEGDQPLFGGEPTNLDQVLASASMEEVSARGSAYETLFFMFFQIAVAGLEVSHIFTNDFRQLRRWLNLPEMVSLGGKLFGVRVTKSPILPPGVLLICGSPCKEEDVGFIQLVMKTSLLEVCDAGAGPENPRDGDGRRRDEEFAEQVGLTWGRPGSDEEGPAPVPGGDREAAGA